MKTMILVLNSGSSSIKFSLIDIATQEAVFSGIAEKLGLEDASVTFKVGDDKQKVQLEAKAGHEDAMHAIFDCLKQKDLDSSISAIGHRVVHGAEYFKSSIIINDTVLDAIEKCVPLAPLHNPANLLGIKVAMQVAPTLPQIAVFDTAFHQSLPKYAYLYGVPMAWYENYGVRRYGFHGTSHRFVAEEAAKFLNIPLNESAFVSAHLGNGASAAAILNGQSVDTTMGFTPLEGLVMGTRSGDIDPGLLPYLSQKLEVSIEEVINLLNKESGLLGLSGVSSDLRELEAAANGGNKNAQIALEVFTFRIAKYIGALMVSLPRVDAIIFTGGIGENSNTTRAKVIERLAALGYVIDAEANNTTRLGKQGIITAKQSPKAVVINTNEELMIALDTYELIQK